MNFDTNLFTDLDRKSFFHPFSALAKHEEDGGQIFSEGNNSTLKDVNGKHYLDAIAGLWCVNVGYGSERMANAISDQAKKLPYYQALTSYGTDIAAEYSARLLNLSPVPMSKVFFGSSGSDANDSIIKMIWYYNNVLGKPEKKKIISRKHGYHGSTIFAAGLTGFNNLHHNFDLPLNGILHTSATHPLWDNPDKLSESDFVVKLLSDLEDLIIAENPETIAAFIAEPIMAGGGVLVPPAGYFEGVQKILTKYEILFIADEVVTGFGRTGKMFGTESFNLNPDFITLAKGITSGYVPLSASLVSEKVWRVLVEGSKTSGAFGHGYTYSGHPIAMKAAMTNLDIIESDNLLENVVKRGNQLRELLTKEFAGNPYVGDIRGFGLLAAVEFVSSNSPLTPFPLDLKVGQRIARAAFENGLIVRPLSESNTIAFSPAFVITEEEIVEIVAKFKSAVDQIMPELNS